jgi:DNA-binding LacI/PurR family transcriptional regulator
VTWGPVGEGKFGHFVGSDNRAGAQTGVAHLISLGRQKIAFLGDHSEHCPEFRQRFDGYQSALRAAGLPILPGLQPSADVSEESGWRQTLALIESGAKFDALFAACDIMAIGAIKALRERGLRVPEDVAVVGFDDIDGARFTNPPLTTVRQDTESAGEVLVTTLLRLVAGETVDGIMIPTRLIVRESCGAVLVPTMGI